MHLKGNMWYYPSDLSTRPGLCSCPQPRSSLNNETMTNVREERAFEYLCRFSHWVSFWWSISFRCSFCSLRCAVIDVIIVDDTILTAFINFYQCGISVYRCCRTRWTNVITSSLSYSEYCGNFVSQRKHPLWDPFLFLGIRCTHRRSLIEYVTSYSRVARPCEVFSRL